MTPELTLVVLLLVGAADNHQKEAAPSRYPHAELLVEPKDLTNPATAGQFRILDARSREQYLAGHIPGAAWVDHATWMTAFGEGKDQDGWAGRIGELGIDVETPVVIYDNNATKEAARIWWILRYWGIKDVRLLNGGWQGWQAASQKIDRSESTYPAQRPKLSPQANRLATKSQLLESFAALPLQILDTRSREEYCGEGRTAKRNGAIPGAVHLEWSDVIDKPSQRFKTPADLAKLFRDAHVDLQRSTVTHCQSGGRAAVMAFALELMGANQVRNYYKSWAEWGNAADTPVERPKK